MTAGAVLKYPRQFFLHIGSDKAGSTALQAHLAANRELLLQHGIYVPLIGRAAGLGHHGLFFQNFTLENAHNLVAEIDTQPAGDSVLMSWEGIHVLNEEILSRFASMFPRCNFHIIFYIREQAELIQTGFLQQIKSHERCAAELFNTIDTQPATRNFYETAKKFERHFPGCQLDITLYDRDEFPRKNIVYHFFSILSENLNLDDIAIFDSEINPSLGIEEVRILASIEEHYPEINAPVNAWKRYRLVELLLVGRGVHDSRHSSYFLSEAQVEECRKYFLRSNTALTDEYGVSEKLIEANKPVWNGEAQQSALGCPITQAKEAELLRFASVNYMNLALCKRYDIPMAALLDKGWSRDSARDQWWAGSQCILRGAINLECFTPPKRYLRFALAGEYGEDIHELSTVLINGKVQGEYNLTACAFLLPLERVTYPYIIELDIRHYAAKSGAGLSATGMPRYYNLQRFQCTAVIQPDPPGRPPFAKKGPKRSPGSVPVQQ